jgi:hypothetical protein
MSPRLGPSQILPSYARRALINTALIGEKECVGRQGTPSFYKGTSIFSSCRAEWENISFDV